jgi:uncharacterized membrane protein
MNWFNLSNQTNELNNHRQFIWPEMTPQDWLMEFLSIVGLIAMFVVIAFYYPKLPPRVPVHFDVHGNTEGLGDRIQVWIMPGISLFLYFFLPMGLRFNLIRRSSRFINRVNTQQQFNGRIRLLRFQKIVLIWGFFYISLTSIKLALHSGNGPATWFVPVFLALLIIPSVFFLFWLKQNR